MTATAPDSETQPRHAGDDSISASLFLLEAMLDQAPDHTFDTAYFEEVGKKLRRLHARLRIHHAVDYARAGGKQSAITPELQGDLTRLRAEHPAILRQNDRLVRSVEAMADRTLEDKEVFLLRGRELIAMLRRHEAEEDRLLYLSVWRDTGGEA